MSFAPDVRLPASTHPSRVRRWSTHLAFLAVVCLCCAPLFVGLSGRDFENDEAIYSYAVDRILDTGDWVTPRLIPYDYPFLEKPPLKFWMVAAGISTGLLPRNEFGFRFLDALFGAFAFLYVFELARYLAGPLAGLSAVLVLFTLDPLLFEHGLRSNNMEAALVLSYCGGIYHFAGWIDGRRRTRVHAVAAAAFLVLGVMTKFVAAVFLPAIWVVSLVLTADARRHLREKQRDAIIAVVVASAAIAPWFIYEFLHVGTDLWKHMVGGQVVQRFTTGLDPRHLQPWDFYLSQLWVDFSQAQTQWIALAGLGVLAFRARREWLSRLLLVWAILPIVGISLVNSKVIHYLYPFLPPLAIGAGAAVAEAARLLGRISRGVARPATRQWLYDVLLAIALAGTGAAVWTAIVGPIYWNIGDVEVFRNSSIWRPLLIAVVLFVAGARHGRLAPSLQCAVVAALLPFSAYADTVQRLHDVDRPLQALQTCAASLPPPRATRVYLHYDKLYSHSYYYYLRNPAPWADNLNIETNEVRRHLPPFEETVVLFPRDDYRRFVRNLSEMGVTTVEGDPSNVTSVVLPFSNEVVLLLPNELQRCAESMKAAGQGVEARVLAAAQ